MQKELRAHLEDTLEKFNAFPTRMTREEDIRSLIEQLFPIATDKELVRLGPADDGGYLVPDDLDGISTCFSPGVSSISGFELDCANLGMQVYLADRSVDRPAEEHKNFHFTKKFIGSTAVEGFTTLERWVSGASVERESDLMLQMDVEGYEFEIFLSCNEALINRFRIIVAEFHMLDQLWNAPFFRIANSTFNKILKTHACVHIHPNNCCGTIQKRGLSIPRVMEFTFLRRDRIRKSAFQTSFPHALDGHNTPNQPLLLPKCWYRQP